MRKNKLFFVLVFVFVCKVFLVAGGSASSLEEKYYSLLEEVERKKQIYGSNSPDVFIAMSAAAQAYDTWQNSLKSDGNENTSGNNSSNTQENTKTEAELALEKLIREAKQDLDNAKLALYKFHQENPSDYYSNAFKELNDEVVMNEKVIKDLENKLDAISIGDPVLVTSGKFLFEDTDMTLFVGSNIFSIKRTYRTGPNYVTSNGLGWETILDVGLVRGVTNGIDEEIRDLEGAIRDLESIVSPLSKYGSSFSDIESFKNTIENEKKKINTVITELKKEMLKTEKIMALNTYKLNSAFSENSTGNGSLIYKTETGINIVFSYCENGIWKPTTGEESQYMVIKSRDGKDVLSESGFILYERGGEELWFDKWGLLEKKLDRNNNETVFVRDESTKRIQSIQLPNNRILNISYTDNGFVSNIVCTNGKSVSYEYNGKYLTKCIDENGFVSLYEYDTQGYISKFTKPDGSVVHYSYNMQNSNGEKRTTSTTNEEGFVEYFNYDLENRVTEYTDYSGRKSYTYYDSNHKVTKEIDCYGIITSYTYDSNTGNMLSKTVNGNTTEHFYDKRGNKIQSLYSDGSSKRWDYNHFDQVIEFIDRDGIEQKMEYDSSGNFVRYLVGGEVVMNAQYDDKGKVTSISDWQSNRKYYVYDEHFNIIEIKSKNCSEKFEYNISGQLTQYTNGENQNWKYEYLDSKTIELQPNGLQRTFFYNKRQKIERIEEIDLLTGEKREKIFKYDKTRRLIAIETADKIIYQCDYYPTNEKRREVFGEIGVEDYWVVEYELNMEEDLYTVHQKKYNKDQVQIGATSSQTYTNEQKKFGSEVSITTPYGKTSYTFNNWNILTRIENALGEVQDILVSSEGRVLEEQSMFGGWYEYLYDSAGNLASVSKKDEKSDRYVYNPDKSIASIISANGHSTNFTYDENGNIISEVSDTFGAYYTYDNAGRLVQQILGNAENILTCEQFIKFEYSDNNRSVTVNYGNIYSYMYEINAWGEIISKKDCNNNGIDFVYDSSGMIKKTIDAYGNETHYGYNGIGKVAKIMYPDNSFVSYEYNHLMQLEKVIDSNGVEWQGKYDTVGNLISEKGRLLPETEYTYDALGRITVVKKAGKIIEEYEYTKNTLNYIDGNNNSYFSYYDDFGNMNNEINRLGNSQLYTFDYKNRVDSLQDFNGNTVIVEYNEKTNSQTLTYSDGSFTLATYNMSGQIIEAENNFGKICYYYNKAGLLERQFDSSVNEYTYFTYDNTGKRKSLLTEDRYISYVYGKNGELLSIDDSEQNLCINFEYDSMMREIKRYFGNGVVQKTTYDSIGRKIFISETNSNREITRAEVYVYNDLGQLCLVANEKGQVTKYEYNSLGQLQTVYNPYSDDKMQQDITEASENGLFFFDTINADVLFLTQKEYTQLAVLLENVSPGKSNKLSTLNGVWKETYTYDNNGNRLSKTTNIGTIEYCYDADNRLIQSGTTIDGTIFEYDNNGNLLKKENSYKTEQYSYNLQNRMIESMVVDNQQNNIMLATYNYDPLGRRNYEKISEESAKISLHDGLSHDIIRVCEANKIGTQVSKYMFGGDNMRYEVGEETPERYRYVESIAGNQKILSTDNLSLYANGKPLATKSFAVNGESNLSYLGTDRLSSVRQTTNQYGDITAQFHYDVFGTPHTGAFTTQTFGYTGKTYDPTTQLYNYGYRDYSPQTARFTTVDPIRDGSNWFSYVVNDPVNFVDLWGLEPQNMSKEDRQKYIDFVLGLNDYNKNSNSHGIPNKYDCADVATHIFNEAMKLTSEGSRLKELNPLYGAIHENDVTNIHSSDFFNESSGNISYYKNDDGSNITDFNNVHIAVGTLMIWKGPGVTTDKKGNIYGWIGHIATVIDVQKKDDGSVTNIKIIHGHTGGNKTDTVSISNQEDLNEYVGEFLGFAEMGENSTCKPR